ncbi:MAG: response regulator transcription factor [Lautropia sp.]|nr:response regulator transcription factor [Lautropia sp.]
MNRVLLIDDDEDLGPPLKAYFGRFDLQLEQAFTPGDGLAQVASGAFDAVILDIMLPEMDGFEVCRTLRRSSDLPIIMLTARGELTDRVVGLELGADDYLPKPFEPRELVARVQTVLRRFRAAQQAGAPPARANPVESLSVLRFEGLTIDTARRSVQRAGDEIDLTGTEYELLLMLAQEPGRVFSRDDILNRLRGHEADLYTRAVDIVVSRLRRKLAPLDCIKTLRNAGYALALRSLN